MTGESDPESEAVFGLVVLIEADTENTRQLPILTISR